MSATDARRVELSSALHTLPEFEFEYAVDDRRGPAEVTIYDPLATDVTTHWLTADARTVVDLVDVA